MGRLDLYTHPHKAVRELLFEALAAVGRTDLAREHELPELLATVRRTLRLTREHARHEEREIHPILRRLAPEVAAGLEAGHARADGLARELERCLARIEGAPAVERVSLGRRVHARLGELVADALQHMALEESRASRILWAHLGDEELSAVQDRILDALEPDALAEWVELWISAGNASERAELLARLASLFPAGALERASARARAWLGDALWNATLEDAEAHAARAGAVS